LDWRPAVRETVEGMRAGRPVESLAAGFHAALVRSAVTLADRLDAPRLALSGGVFANRLLTEELLVALGDRQVLLHSQLPPTDGCVAAGQLWVGAQGRDL
jgi:hydrogenase maturation protein HypF